MVLLKQYSFVFTFDRQKNRKVLVWLTGLQSQPKYLPNLVPHLC